MNLKDQIRQFRVLAKDAALPYRAETVDVAGWLSDAQVQGCVRGRLLVAEDDPAMCRIPLTPGQSVYPLHPAVYEIIDLRIRSADGRVRAVTIKSREWLEAEHPGWRDWARPAVFAIQNDTSLRMVGMVEAGDVLELEAYRLPLAPLEVPANPDDPSTIWPEPEIHQAHHEHLIQWALHRAFSVPDSELFDPDRARLAEEEFTAYFGPLPDSDMRRKTREDVQHYVRGYLA